MFFAIFNNWSLWIRSSVNYPAYIIALWVNLSVYSSSFSEISNNYLTDLMINPLSDKSFEDFLSTLYSKT